MFCNIIAMQIHVQCMLECQRNTIEIVTWQVPLICNVDQWLTLRTVPCTTWCLCDGYARTMKPIILTAVIITPYDRFILPTVWTLTHTDEFL